MLIFPSPYVVTAAGGSRELSFEHSDESATDSTLTTFTSVPIPNATATREALVVVYMSISGASAASITVYGVSATLVVSTNDGNTWIGLFRVAIPTGTTGDVAVSGVGGNFFNTGIDVYRADNLGALNASTTNNVTTTAMNLNVATNADDAVIASVMHFFPGQTTAWTGVTEQTDRIIEGSNTGSSGFINSGAVSETRTVTATVGTTPSRMAGLSASFA